MTKQLFEKLEQKIEYLRGAWESGAFVSDDVKSGSAASAHAVGTCQALREILNLTANDLMEIDNE